MIADHKAGDINNNRKSTLELINSNYAKNYVLSFNVWM